MTKEALKLALEALEEATTYTSSPSWSPSMTEECNKAITSIKEALAEDALQRLSDIHQEMEAHDPVDYRGWVLREVLFDNGEPVGHREPTKAEPQEPVLVVEKEPDYWSGGHFYKGDKPHIYPTKVWGLQIGTKLYTTPAQRKPLTHEQRVDLLAKFEAHKHEWHAPAILIDMVEAAHNIKENT